MAITKVTKKEVRLRVPQGLIDQFDELNEWLQMWKNVQEFMVWASKKAVVDILTSKKQKQPVVREVYQI